MPWLPNSPRAASRVAGGSPGGGFKVLGPSALHCSREAALSRGASKLGSGGQPKAEPRLASHARPWECALAGSATFAGAGAAGPGSCAAAARVRSFPAASTAATARRPAAAADSLAGGRCSHCSGCTGARKGCCNAAAAVVRRSGSGCSRFTTRSASCMSTCGVQRGVTLGAGGGGGGLTGGNALRAAMAWGNVRCAAAQMLLADFARCQTYRDLGLGAQDYGFEARLQILTW